MFKKQNDDARKKQPPILSELTKNPDGSLTAKLMAVEYKKEMDGYLNALRTDMRFDDHINDAFTHEYNEADRSFTIKPVNATIEQILSELYYNNFIEPPSRGNLYS